MVVRFNRPSKYLTLHAILSMSNPLIPNFDKVQMHLRGLERDSLFSIMQTLSKKRIIPIPFLFYWYINAMCSEDILSLVHAMHNFAAVTRHSKHILMCRPDFFSISLVRSKFHSAIYFPRFDDLWNRLPAECFRNQYNLDLMKSKNNCHLSYIT